MEVSSIWLYTTQEKKENKKGTKKPVEKHERSRCKLVDRLQTGRKRSYYTLLYKSYRSNSLGHLKRKQECGPAGGGGGVRAIGYYRFPDVNLRN